MSDEVTDWTQLREFKAVDLPASYVLSWSVEGGALGVELDLCLTPEHPFYEPPRPAERACIRPAVLEFPQLASLARPGEPGASPEQLTARLGSGRLQGLKRIDDGVYRLDGRFGSVVVRAGRPLLRLRRLAP